MPGVATSGPATDPRPSNVPAGEPQEGTPPVVAPAGPATGSRPSDVPADVQMEDVQPIVRTSCPAVGPQLEGGPSPEASVARSSGDPLPGPEPAEPAEIPQPLPSSRTPDVVFPTPLFPGSSSHPSSPAVASARPGPSSAPATAESPPPRPSVDRFSGPSPPRVG